MEVQDFKNPFYMFGNQLEPKALYVYGGGSKPQRVSEWLPPKQGLTYFILDPHFHSLADNSI
jgi:hypothetical protein